MKKLVFLFALLSYALLTLAQNYSYDLVHQKLEFWLDPAKRYITGAVELTFVTAQPADSITVDLASALTVDSVSMDGQKPDFSHENDMINVRFDALPAGLHGMTVYYHGEPATSGFESFSTGTHGDGVPVMWTLSEPYGAKDWFPTKNDLGDKIDSLDVIIHTQPQYIAASNGVLVLDTVVDGVRTFHWKSHYPIATYLVAFALTNYEVYTDTAYLGDTLRIPVMNFVYPEDADYARGMTPYAARCIEYFSQQFIPYPFYKEKYGQAQFGWGGGMEHQTITFVGGFSQSLLSHELAHQWFGDYITCGSWHEIYLNEAFATYLEGLTAQAGLASYTFRDWLLRARNNVLSDPGGSIYVEDTTDVDRIFDYRLTYQKGALFLHQLRWMIGDSAFFAGLRDYLTDPQVVNGYAHTADLKRNLEKACGCDLTYYFDQWLYGEGFPRYTINVRQIDDTTYNVELSQTPLSSGVEFFRLKIPLEFSNDSESTTVILDNTQNSQTFTVTVPFQATHVVFDPQMWLIATANVEFTTILDELVSENMFLVYPTVCDKTLNVVINKDFNASGMIKIRKSNGELVRQIDLPYINQTFRTELDVSGFQSGAYLLEIYAGTGQDLQLKQTIKFIKL